MLEITLHDGPGRMGKWRNKKTPSLIEHGEISLIKDQPMAYNVPRELAEWSVENTIKSAENYDKESMAVIHGGRYLDLRIKCGEELEKLGFRNFLLANIEELMKRPQDLVKIMVALRDKLIPNSAIYIPLCKPSFIPLLSYLGADLYGDLTAGFYARLGIMITPDMTYNLKEYQLYDLDFSQLRDYNLNTLDFVLREIRENMKNGTLRNLLEMRCASSPDTMTALRTLDRKYPSFTDKYLQLY